VTSPPVRLEAVTLSLGGRTVLEDVSLALASGEFVGLLGPNGAGKTTLMRAILGLLPPAAGRIEVFGEAPKRGNAAIGYMPQTRPELGGARLNGWDFVASVVNGSRPGLPFHGRAARQEVARVLDLVGAASLARRPIAALSGGERQRLLLAQALLGRPKLLLLDEPLSHLDPSRQDAVVALAKRLQRELGVAVLFSAHELNPLLGALDRVLYLGNRQAALGTVAEVITGPVLSRLYGAEIEVVELRGRIFVMSGQQLMQRDVHDAFDGHLHG
jgi:zinc/manganese transport system ATP-binding protein